MHKWLDKKLMNPNNFLFYFQYFVFFGTVLNNMLCWQVYEKISFDRMLHAKRYAFLQKKIAFCYYVNEIGLHSNYLNFLWKPFSSLLGLCSPLQPPLADGHALSAPTGIFASAAA